MHRPRLLLVDEDARAERFAALLREAGFDTTLCSSGLQALASARAQPPDLVVSELHLSDLDGLELLRGLRAGDGSAAPFVFLTLDRSFDARVRALGEGAADYIAKPIYVKELVSRLQLLLRSPGKASPAPLPAEGDLADEGLARALAALEPGAAATLECHSPDGNGRLWLRDGRVCDAEAGPRTGEPALQRILSWTRGAWHALPPDPRRPDRIGRATGELLTALRQPVALLQHLHAALPPIDSVPEVDFIALASRLDRVPDHANVVLRLVNGYRSLRGILDQSPADDAATLSALNLLLAHGIVRVPGVPAPPVVEEAEATVAFAAAPLPGPADTAETTPLFASTPPPRAEPPPAPEHIATTAAAPAPAPAPLEPAPADAPPPEPVAAQPLAAEPVAPEPSAPAGEPAPSAPAAEAPAPPREPPAAPAAGPTAAPEPVFLGRDGKPLRGAALARRLAAEAKKRTATAPPATSLGEALVDITDALREIPTEPETTPAPPAAAQPTDDAAVAWAAETGAAAEPDLAAALQQAAAAAAAPPSADLQPPAITTVSGFAGLLAAEGPPAPAHKDESAPIPVVRFPGKKGARRERLEREARERAEAAGADLATTAPHTPVVPPAGAEAPPEPAPSAAAPPATAPAEPAPTPPPPVRPAAGPRPILEDEEDLAAVGRRPRRRRTGAVVSLVAVLAVGGAAFAWRAELLSLATRGTARPAATVSTMPAPVVVEPAVPPPVPSEPAPAPAEPAVASPSPVEPAPLPALPASTEPAAAPGAVAAVAPPPAPSPAAAPAKPPAAPVAAPARPPAPPAEAPRPAVAPEKPPAAPPAAPPAGAEPAAPPPGAPSLSPEKQAEYDKFFAAGLGAAADENYKGAVDQFNRALRVRRDAPALRELGKALYGRESYAAALKVLREAVKLDPKDADAYLHLGLISQESGKKGEACKAYRRVRFLEPDSDRSKELESVIKNLGC